MQQAKRQTFPKSPPVTVGTNAHKTEYVYNARDRLTQVKHNTTSATSDVQYNFTYDALGHSAILAVSIPCAPLRRDQGTAETFSGVFHLQAGIKTSQSGLLNWSALGMRSSFIMMILKPLLSVFMRPGSLISGSRSIL